MATAENQSFFGEKMTFRIISQIEGNRVETTFVVTALQYFRSDGKEFTLVVRGAAAFGVPLDYRRPEYVPFSINHPCDVRLYVVIYLQRDTLAEIFISFDTFIIIFQPPFRVAGCR